MKKKIKLFLHSLNVGFHFYDKDGYGMEIGDIKTCEFCSAKRKLVEIDYLGPMGGQDLIFEKV